VTDAPPEFIAGQLRAIVGIELQITRIGHRSAQLDVIVNSIDQPIVYPPDQAGIYLIEAVTAAAEVKTTLTTHELDRAIGAAEKFKRLRPRSSAGDTRYTNPADDKRFYSAPPFFLFAYESKVNPQTLIDRLAAALPVSALEGQPGGDQEAVDAVFVLGRGFAINYGTGDGAFAYVTPDGTLSASGWVWFEADHVLANMFVWLHAVMPTVHRFQSVLLPYLMESGVSGGMATIMSHGFTARPQS